MYATTSRLRLVVVFSCLAALAVEAADTYCNPMNLEYCFQAADPSIVRFRGDYYLVASKSRGYWYSADLKEWTLVPVDTTQIAEIDDYAPTIWVEGDALCYTATGSYIYRSQNPKLATSWQVDSPNLGTADRMVFRDDDQSLYYYAGLGRILGMEMYRSGDAYTLSTTRRRLIHDDPQEYGWERRWVEVNGSYPLKPASEEEQWETRSLVEGAWMTKHNGTYYLQYAAPGTQWTVYSDGVYTSDSPLGQFTYAPNNPICHKPSGFVGGAGHGCTFTDPRGNYWRAATASLAISHNYERRLVMFPAGFDADGLMYTNTYLGDFPQYSPGANPSPNPEQSNLVGWMLLSYGKTAQASSNSAADTLAKVFDENIKTYWSSGSRSSGQWITVDLGTECTINAIQVNFYKSGEDRPECRTGTNVYHQYIVEVSNDGGSSWRMIIDKSANTKDVPHDYVPLPEPVTGRHVKLTSLFMPADGMFCLSDLRVFGTAGGAAPQPVTEFVVNRSSADPRDVTISWTPVSDAVGYVIRWGIAPGKLYNNFQVMHDQDNFQISNGSECTLWYLSKGITYYFTIDVFNENGITRGTIAKSDDGQTALLSGTPSTPCLNNSAQPELRRALPLGPSSMLSTEHYQVFDIAGRRLGRPHGLQGSTAGSTISPQLYLLRRVAK